MSLSTPAPDTMARRIAYEIRSAITVTDLQAEAVATRILRAMRNPTPTMIETGWAGVMLTPDDHGAVTCRALA